MDARLQEGNRGARSHGGNLIWHQVSDVQIIHAFVSGTCTDNLGADRREI
jgi:hypothetical protein